MAMRLMVGIVPLSMLLVPSAIAFSSLPPGTSPHDEITRAAAEETDYPKDGRDALLEAVRAPDLNEMEWDPSGDKFVAMGLDEEYRAAHHCDRLLPADDATSFRDTVAFISEQREAADRHIANGNASDAVSAIGYALHAVQDCFSHSSSAEGGPTDLDALEAALLDGGPMPAGLRLVAVSSEIDSPGEPDDPYAHDHHAKDSPHYNDVAEADNEHGHNHYETAHEYATRASARVLTAFLEWLDDDQRQQLADVDPSETSRYTEALNAPTVALIVGAALGLGGLSYAGARWWKNR